MEAGCSSTERPGKPNLRGEVHLITSFWRAQANRRKAAPVSRPLARIVGLYFHPSSFPGAPRELIAPARPREKQPKRSARDPNSLVALTRQSTLIPAALTILL